MSVAEKAIVYATLILADDNVDITADKLQAITKAAGVQVEPIYFNLFAKAFAGRDVNELLLNVGSAAAAAPAAGAAAAGGAAAAPAEEKKKEEAEEEESDDDMGFGLFD
ncbi:60S acidic ribosomal protein P1 [Coemansia guatemalensis]|uniref:60S acidic ribosomal protein P1 n=1 Tax=Coemansia guatemalensis TaxID=2761395 RepID=A0A9W8HZJ9_9FUNG|nr:60S acidic ribosomal protein P1 [Coemansia guatemalensis]